MLIKKKEENVFSIIINNCCKKNCKKLCIEFSTTKKVTQLF